MKLVRLMNLVLGSALTITAVGCKTHPANPMTIHGNRPTVGEAGLSNGSGINSGDGLNGGGVSATSATGGIPASNPILYSNYIDDRAALKDATVYFGYDKSEIKSTEQSKLEQVASYLKSNGTAALRIEGNCDERGTEEYNRTLGDRRAQAAREYLSNLGIDPQKILTLSNGEDHPAESGHNEAAWSKNRRDEFVVLHPPAGQ